jgi:hypothetical protein
MGSGNEGVAPSFMTSVPDVGEWLASCPSSIIPGERANGTHWMGGWMGPRVGLESVEKRKIPFPCCHLACSSSLYELSYALKMHQNSNMKSRFNFYDKSWDNKSHASWICPKIQAWNHEIQDVKPMYFKQIFSFITKYKRSSICGEATHNQV